MEATEQTLKREFEEEIGAKIEVDSLMAVGEIFFPWGDRPCHQICLYYKIHLCDPAAIPLNGMGMMNWGTKGSIWTSAGFRWKNCGMG